MEAIRTLPWILQLPDSAKLRSALGYRYSYKGMIFNSISQDVEVQLFSPGQIRQPPLGSSHTGL